MPSRGAHFLDVRDRFSHSGVTESGSLSSCVANTTTGRFSSISALGPLFHFAGGIAFGVDVGNFLKFEGAFERDRVVNAASEVQENLYCEKNCRAKVSYTPVSSPLQHGPSIFVGDAP